MLSLPPPPPMQEEEEEQHSPPEVTWLPPPPPPVPLEAPLAEVGFLSLWYYFFRVCCGFFAFPSPSHGSTPRTQVQAAVEDALLLPPPPVPQDSEGEGTLHSPLGSLEAMGGDAGPQGKQGSERGGTVDELQALLHMRDAGQLSEFLAGVLEEAQDPDVVSVSTFVWPRGWVDVRILFVYIHCLGGHGVFLSRSRSLNCFVRWTSRKTFPRWRMSPSWAGFFWPVLSCGNWIWAPLVCAVLLSPPSPSPTLAPTSRPFEDCKLASGACHVIHCQEKRIISPCGSVCVCVCVSPSLSLSLCPPLQT